MPSHTHLCHHTHRNASSIHQTLVFTVVVCMAIGMLGCTAPALREDSPDPKTLVDEETAVQLVGDLARPWGLNGLAVEGIALVVGLSGTGSDAAPSAQRAAMIREMQTRQVDSPNQLLASANTSLALVRVVLPPGVHAGSRLDVEVTVPKRSETASLEGGWLMKTRLTELAVLNRQIAKGHVMALAAGDILVDSLLEGRDDSTLAMRGRILGGGLVTKTRHLGMSIRSSYHSVQTSSRVAKAINLRFHTYDRGLQRGVATAKTDKFIDLTVHPTYRHNLIRFVRVCEAIPVRFGAEGVSGWLTTLQDELLDPRSSSLASVRLEALGTEGQRVLREGLKSENDEIRFYSAEALAYQDQGDAAPVLAQLAREEPAFRWHALTALSAMDDLQAYDVLSEMLHVDSAETRYGAFRAIRENSPSDPLVRGEILGENFRFHVVESDGPSMVHVARQRAPEIVLFGKLQPLRTPLILVCGNNLVIKSTDDERLKISRFLRDEDETVTCESDLGAMIRGIAEVGGTYADIVAALVAARKQDVLTTRLAFEAVAKPGRTYHRHESSETAHRGSESIELEVSDRPNGDDWISLTSPPSASENSSASENPSASEKTSSAPSRPSAGNSSFPPHFIDSKAPSVDTSDADSNIPVEFRLNDSP